MAAPAAITYDYYTLGMGRAEMPLQKPGPDYGSHGAKPAFTCLTGHPGRNATPCGGVPDLPESYYGT